MVYVSLKETLQDIIRGETNFIANAANFSSVLYHGLSDLNWVGFYFLDGDELILGPYQGKPACIRIPVGKGVTGKSVKIMRVINVEDVHKFPGHIPCDPHSNSEIVIPIIYKNQIYGVLDIDSPLLNRFTNRDVDEIEDLLKILIDNSDLTSLRKYYE